MDALCDPARQAFRRGQGGLAGQPQADLAELRLVERRRQEADPLPCFVRMLRARQRRVEVSLDVSPGLLHLRQCACAQGRIGHCGWIHPR